MVCTSKNVAIKYIITNLKNIIFMKIKYNGFLTIQNNPIKRKLIRDTISAIV